MWTGAICLAVALVFAPACSRAPSETPPDSSGRPTQSSSERSEAQTAPPGDPGLDPGSVDRQPPELAPPAEPVFVELLPGIRVDRERRVVEFDGHVPINVNDRDTLGEFLVVFLECVVTTPRAEKDHETLVVADIRPSNLHAALLAVGLEPGAPGDWEWDGEQVQRIAARGDEIEVTFRWEGPGGEMIERDPRELIVNDKTGKRFGGSAWVFAGSIEDAPAPHDPNAGPAGRAPSPPQPFYAADATGLLVGLATFGTEVIAWREVISHAADVDTPVWIADRATTPPYETRVTVQFRPAAE